MHMPRSKQRPGNQHLRDAEELPQDRHLSNLPKFSVRYLSKDVVYPLIPKMKVEFCYNCLNYNSLFNASFFQLKKKSYQLNTSIWCDCFQVSIFYYFNIFSQLVQNGKSLKSVSWKYSWNNTHHQIQYQMSTGVI